MTWASDLENETKFCRKISGMEIRVCDYKNCLKADYICPNKNICKVYTEIFGNQPKKDGLADIVYLIKGTDLNC
ncbi:MAG: hypothetical protein QW051_04010 [Candidatus Aenigmatarchaeota archaeon]